MRVWTEADALTALATIPGFGRQSLAQVRQRFGTLAAAMEAPIEDLAREAYAGRCQLTETILRTGDLARHLDRVVAATRAAGARVLTEVDPEWPRRLAAARIAEPESQPPPMLYYRGEPRTLSGLTVAIVGSRRADPLAREQAARIAAGLAQAGATIVSGGAAGVDGAAHRGALEAGGRTIVVLGTGVDVAYPAGNRALFRKVLDEGGVVVSESPPGTQPHRGVFPKRNRIISALADLTIVVAAAARSGALITAQHAWAQERLVASVPGDPRRALSQGTNRLLVWGAHAILEPEDAAALLVQAKEGTEDALTLADWLATRVVGSGDGALATGPQVPLSSPARVLLGRLEAIPYAADKLAVNTGLSAADVAAALAELEVAGLAERRGGGYVLAASGSLGRAGKES